MADASASVDEKGKRSLMDSLTSFTTFPVQRQGDEAKVPDSRGNFMSTFGKVAQAMIGQARQGNPSTSQNEGQGEAPSRSETLAQAGENADVVSPLKATTDDPASHRPFSASFRNVISQIEADHDYVDLNIGDMDITTEDIDFDEMDEDLKHFQQDKDVREALSKGVNLREFAKQIEHDLRVVERESIQDYIQESEHLVQLHEDINSCDTILAQMQTMLSEFQSNLGNISSEIKLLQEQSQAMNYSLSNRKKVEEEMVTFIGKTAISPKFISEICDGPINDAYIENLKRLHEKITFASSQKARATDEVLPELEKLRDKAVLRCRDHLMNLYNQLKKPNTNVQIIQQSSLLKYKYMNQFLNTHNKTVSKELQAIYADIISKFMHTSFSKYLGAIVKLSFEVAASTDLLGSEESQIKSFISGKLTTKGKSSIFTLSGRDEVLQMIEKDAIVPHHASQANQKFLFEIIFRSMQHTLIEAATSEFLFILEFFGRADLFNQVFAKSISLYQETLQTYLNGSFDCVGLFLMICVTNKHQLVMTRRRIPSLEQYFDGTNIALWTRFKMVFDMNMTSIRQAQHRALWKSDFHPHYITRRYGEFVSSLLKLNTSYESDTLIGNLSMLQKEMDKFLVKLAECYPVKKHQIIFIINNYDVVLSILEENSISSENLQPYQNQLDAATRRFVEDELKESFGPVINYVMTIEPISESSIEKAKAQIPDSKVQQIIRDFSVSWTKNIEKLNSNVQSYFSNFKNGEYIMKQLLTQLILYYTRFYNLVRKLFPREAFIKDMVVTNSITFEARKYSRTFA